MKRTIIVDEETYEKILQIGPSEPGTTPGKIVAVLVKHVLETKPVLFG